MALEPEPALWRVGITYNNVFEIKEKKRIRGKKKKKVAETRVKIGDATGGSTLKYHGETVSVYGFVWIVMVIYGVGHSTFFFGFRELVRLILAESYIIKIVNFWWTQPW